MKIPPQQYNHSKLILLVSLGDNKYKWMIGPWVEQLNKYWDYGCGIDVVAVSHRDRALPKNIKKCVIPISNWSDRVSWYLSRTTSKYFLLAHEDYFLTARPDYEKLKSIVADMEKSGTKISVLNNINGYAKTIISQNKGIERVRLDFAASGSEMTHHIPMIDVKYFASKMLVGGETINESENNVEIRLKQLNPKAYTYTNKKIFQYMEVMRRGTIRTEARLKYGIDDTIDTEEFSLILKGKKIRQWEAGEMAETILLVHCGDRNKWIWPIWWEYFKRYWDWDCGIEVVWVGETEVPEFGGFRKYATKKCIWSNGLIKFLSKYCTAKYIIYSCDDFLLLERPNYAKIKELINKMNVYDIPMIRTHHDRFISPHIDKSEKHCGDLYRVNSSGYLMTYQVPIISKELLLSTLEPNMSIWNAERRGGRIIRAAGHDTYIYLDEILYKYIEVVRQGQIKGGRGKYIDAAKSGNVPNGYLPEDNDEYMKTWHSMRL